MSQPGGHAQRPSRRTGIEETLAGLSLQPEHPGDAVSQVLVQDPEAVNRRAIALSELALGSLPVGRLSPQQKVAYGRQGHPMLSALSHNITDALRLTEASGLPMPARAEQLERLREQREVYGALRLLGLQLMDGAQDQRTIVASFCALLIESALDAADRRYHREGASAAERERLLRDFGPVLLLLDEVLGRPEERRPSAQRDPLEQAEDARADELLAETKQKLRQGLLAPRAPLLAAARGAR